jgi:hypothetical protein
MAIKTPSETFIEQASQLDEVSAEKVLSRMTGKLPKRYMKEKLSKIEALAIQLELEDELLQDWRKNFAEIKSNAEKKVKVTYNQAAV